MCREKGSFGNSHCVCSSPSDSEIKPKSALLINSSGLAGDPAYNLLDQLAVGFLQLDSVRPKFKSAAKF